MATRNAIELWATVPKQDATAASHHTTAQANCTLHLRIMLEAALVVPSMAAMTATKSCWSYLPLSAKENRRMNIEIPMAIHMALMARPTVVEGCLCLLRVARAMVSTEALIMVTGQASVVWPQMDQPKPQVDQAMAI